jgi:serine/threonine-protein kinase
MARNAGDTLLNGQYRILRQLGRGGFGFVYQAQDALLGEDVAIKELIPSLVGDETTLKRFLAEARATMRLSHDRIVRTHNVFSESGNYYIAMEYMAGGSLEERLGEHGALAVGEALRVAAEVCEGLGYAHGRGIVHCDLKPANILFGADGSAKVADFGIAHVSEEVLTRTWQTPAGFVAGTLPYMSPEQAEGVRDDPRIDLYAVGAILYRMLTGQIYLAFDARETPGATADNVYRIRNEAPAPPSTHRPEVPAWLDGVVLQALAKQPEARQDSAGELRAALRQQPASTVAPQAAAQSALLTAAPAARPALSPGPDARRAARPGWFWPAVGGALVLFVALVVAMGAMLGGGGGDETAVPQPTGTAVAAVTVIATQPPTATSRPTATPTGTATPRPTATSTDTPKPTASSTLRPSDTPQPPTATHTPRPTDTRQPAFTSTPRPRPREDLELLSPLHQSTLNTFDVTLQWRAYPEAASYRVKVLMNGWVCEHYPDTCVVDFVDGTNWSPPEDWLRAHSNATFAWEVIALDLSGNEIAICPKQFWFWIRVDG